MPSIGRARRRVEAARGGRGRGLLLAAAWRHGRSTLTGMTQAEGGAPARSSKSAHRETLEAAPMGIVSGLVLGRFCSSRAGGSLREVAADAATTGDRAFSELEGALASPLCALDGVEEEEEEEGSSGRRPKGGRRSVGRTCGRCTSRARACAVVDEEEGRMEEEDAFKVPVRQGCEVSELEKRFEQW